MKLPETVSTFIVPGNKGRGFFSHGYLTLGGDGLKRGHVDCDRSYLFYYSIAAACNISDEGG